MFQDFSMNAAGRVDAAARNGSAMEQVADLLERYPNLSEIELARLINLYRGFSALDVAMMLSDARLAPRLDRFFQDHRARIRTPFRQYAVLIGIAVVGIATLAIAVVLG